MSQIRMIATDLDGTFLYRGQPVMQNVQAARAAMQAGIIVCVCTGRSWTMSAQIIEQMRGYISPYVVTANGAALNDISGPEVRVLSNHYMAPEVFIELAECARENGLSHNVFSNSKLACYRASVPDWFHRFRARFAGLPPEQQYQYTIYDDWDEFIQKEKDTIELFRVPSLSAGGPMPLVMADKVRRIGGLEMSVGLTSHWDVVSNDATKMNGVKDLAAILGFSREQIMTLGDSSNDISMIQWAGVGVAMGDALPEVIAAADYVSADGEQGGFAQAVYEMALGQRG